MVTSDSVWQQWYQVLRNPGRIFLGLGDFVVGWFVTRAWLRALAFLPALLLLLVIFGVSTYGQFLGSATLLERYWELIDRETVQTEEEPARKPPGADAVEGPPQEQLMRDEQVSDFAEILLRRLLQIEKSNKRATYLVARQLERQGRFGQARQLMRSISPESTRGFAPGHAWLVSDRITRSGVKSQQDKESLIHDLEHAMEWEGTGPLMHSLYAEALESEGRVAEAISVLRATAAKEPRLYVGIAAIAHKHNRTAVFEEAVAAAKQDIENKSKNNALELADYVGLARIAVLEQDFAAIIEATQKGLKKNPKDPNLRRLLSEAYRLKYRSGSQTASGSTQVDLSLLDIALKIDPSNPAVSEEIAKLIAMGQQAPPELVDSLKQQLAAGKATALTHILLASRALKDGDLERAIPHLELALRQAPNNPVVLNNLALSLARTDPQTLPRAKKLLETALRAGGRSAELLDSMGEVSMLSGDTMQAIESFEAAIGLDASRISTRNRLREAYEKIGLSDMAKIQSEIIEKLQAAQDAEPAETAAQPAENGDTPPPVGQPSTTDDLRP